MVDELLKWAPLAITVLNLGAGVFFWAVARTLVSKRELGAVEKRIATLEHDRSSAPGWEVINDLKQQMWDVSSDLRAASAQIQGLGDLLKRCEHTINLVEHHLLEAK